jgi:predicted RNA-binding Zn ribbon-like protein
VQQSQPLPPGPRLIVEFVNTYEIDRGADALSGEEAARGWLAGAGLPAEVAHGDLPRLRALREGLRQVLEAHEAGSAPLDGWSSVGLAAAGVRLTLKCSPQEDALRLVPDSSGVGATIGALMAVVHDAVLDGTWRRLKACRSETCRWAFYDSSKNGSAAWCSMAVCGNRAKARRRRRKVAGDPPAH